MKYMEVICNLNGTVVDNLYASEQGRRGLAEMAPALAMLEQDFIYWWNQTLAQRQIGPSRL